MSATLLSSPLDRIISLQATGISLRDALDRIAALAKVRLSYSAEALPLDRAVCVLADRVATGHVLAELLVGTNVTAVAAGADQVVLAPRPPRAVTTDDMAHSLGVLDRVVVTGSAVGASERELTVGLDVVTGRQLARENAGTLSTALDGHVPGVWSWAQSPSTVLGTYGSIRGASSFGLSYPKIYIDGIEVANPLLISRFAPDAIERIEVIRGPQGSALYGTDAISGVVNIVTRHDGTDADGSHTSLRTTAGVTQSAFANDVLTQDHAVSFATGSSTRSADLRVSAGSMGDFIPNGYSRDIMASSSARIVGARGTLSGTARLLMENAGSAMSPLLVRPTLSTSASDTLYEDMLQRSTQPQSIREFTVGTAATLTPSERWTHSFVAGVDGYHLANVQTNFTPIPTVADSALRAAQGGAARGTLRASSVLHVHGNDPTRATITFSAEHAVLRETVAVDDVTTTVAHGATVAYGSTPTHTEVAQNAVQWQTNTGLTTQASGTWNNTLFATGGVRVERDSRLTAPQRTATLPMFGVAAIEDYGPLTVKLRAAYGKGIRPPSTLGHEEFWQPAARSATQPSLRAEEQAGTEIGVDVFLRQALAFKVTRFDQRASNLIQQVAIAADSNYESHRVAYALENLGEISNRGWELEASSGFSRLTISGTLSFVDSRVQKLANGYTGDLLTGDRMLQVPARTGAMNFSWVGDHWYATLGGSRALDWINYDELALTNAFLSGRHTARDLLGLQLRQYWGQYNGGLRVRASVSRDLLGMFAVEISGDNLLNYQRNEPDNITVVPGRTIMTGLRIKF